MFSRAVRYLTLALVALIASLGLAEWTSLPMVAQTPTHQLLSQQRTEVVQQEQLGREFYGKGEFRQAIFFWQEAAQAYQNQRDEVSQARVLSNLALAYQQVGEWTAAQEAIAISLQLLQDQLPRSLQVLAQALNTQGILQLAKGQPQEALTSWQQAAETYEQVNDKKGKFRSQINQVRALQELGLSPRACKLLIKVLNLSPLTCETLTLESLEPLLKSLPSTLSTLESEGWHSLGDILLSIGKGKEAQLVFQSLLPRLSPGEEKAAIFLGLGKAAQIGGDLPTAIAFYQQASQAATTLNTQLSSQLAQLNLLINTQQWQMAETLLPKIENALDQFPLSRTQLYAQINFAENLVRWKKADNYDKLPTWTAIAQNLTNTVAAARQLGDQRAEAYALGSLGGIYEQTQQWATAKTLTEQALLLAQTINSAEITYRWQWQVGRLLSAQGDREQAIATYQQAINTLESISGDLAANPEAQFSFQESVEPVYRQLVNLLLKPDSQGNVPQENLRQARDAIEALQVAELNNFFHEACLEAKPKQIDEVDQQAAVIYPIILPDRLAVILSLPQQPLQYYNTPIPSQELESTIETLRSTLVIRSRRDFFFPAQKLYDWLIRPAESQLSQNNIKTLVFVLDGALRNIPMSVLHDGKGYLLEKYGVALTPGLQLLAAKPLKQKELHALLAGLSKSRYEFPPLKYVTQELAAIEKQVSSVRLLNETFTTEALATRMSAASFPIIHIATHGQFSSNFEETVIVTWDALLNIRQLDNLLKARRASGENTIELLVLSACETATGDRRAALGLAGMAVRSGASSTVATLWSVNDQATAELMSQFYGQLATEKTTKAEALRQAKLALLKNRWYQHPFYWASYVLVGNWL